MDVNDPHDPNARALSIAYRAATACPREKYMTHGWVPHEWVITAINYALGIGRAEGAAGEARRAAREKERNRA